MTIFAPKVPTYQSSVRLRRSTGSAPANVGPSLLVGQSLSRLGNVISIRADEMKKERDAAVVGDLYNQWRDEDRKKLSELLNKKGKDAVGLDKIYDEWFNKSFSEIDQNSENGSQQSMLKGIIDRKRNQNLDILARYQSQEAQRYKNETEAKVVIQAEKDIRGFGFDNQGVSEVIEEVTGWIKSAYPGQDTTAIEQKYRSGLLYANMQERIEQDPKKALETLESWKEELGDEYFKLKEIAEKKSQERLVEDLRDELNAKYTDGVEPNFNKMEDAIQKDKGISDDIKDQVIVWIRSQEREYKARVKQEEQDTQDAEMDTIFEHLRAGRVPDAYKAVLDSTQLTQLQKYRIENIIKSGEKEANKEIYIETAKQAMSGTITRKQIIDGIGVDYSVSDGENLLNELKKAQEPGRTELNRAIKDATDAIEKQVIKGNQLTGYDTRSVDDAYQAVKDFQKQIAEPPEGVTVEEMLDPESPNYVIDKIIQKYQVSFDEQIRRQADKYRVSGQARKPDETPGQYLLRTSE